MRIDISIRDEGSLVLVEPLTDLANSWLRLNTPPDNRQWFGNALVVEHRFADELIGGMVESGLRVRRDK